MDDHIQTILKLENSLRTHEKFSTSLCNKFNISNNNIFSLDVLAYKDYSTAIRLSLSILCVNENVDAFKCPKPPMTDKAFLSNTIANKLGAHRISNLLKDLKETVTYPNTSFETSIDDQKLYNLLSVSHSIAYEDNKKESAHYVLPCIVTNKIFMKSFKNGNIQKEHVERSTLIYKSDVSHRKNRVIHISTSESIYELIDEISNFLQFNTIKKEA